MSQTSSASHTAEEAAHVKRVLVATSYYEVLQIDKTADQITIKKSYRKAALLLHPDRNRAPGASDAFKKVGAAFTTLSDEQKRADYDRYGMDEAERRSQQSEARAQQARSYHRAHDEDFQDMDMFDLFNRMFAQSQHGFVYTNGGAFRRQRFAQPQFFRHAPPQTGPNQPPPLIAQILQLLPLLLLLFAGWMSMRGSDPAFTLEATGRNVYVVNLPMEVLGTVRFYVADVKEHHKNMQNVDYEQQFKRQLTAAYVDRVRYQCHLENREKSTRIFNAGRWWARSDDMKRAQEYGTPSCDLLSKWTKAETVK